MLPTSEYRVGPVRDCRTRMNWAVYYITLMPKGEAIADFPIAEFESYNLARLYADQLNSALPEPEGAI